ncbi:MAG TPA: hypothetical protein VL120_14940, partial [Solirubrobacteraceae bacterium]|nr:hypothetical protein [Solirubrobacteraceae bacterium]
MDEQPAHVTLAAVVERLGAVAGAVELDDLERELGDGAVAALERRFAIAGDRLGLDDLERAVLAAIGLRELSAQLGEALARLSPAAPAGAATPRAIGRLLAGPGAAVADVLAALAPDGRLRRSGAVRLAPAPEATALADRPVVLADRLAALLLGAAIDDPARGARLRRSAPPRLPFGRAEAVARLAALLASPRRPLVAAHGPDAALAVASATGRGLLHVAAAELADGDLAHDAVLAATLEERQLVVDRLGDVQPADRTALADRLAPVRPGAVLCLAGPDELVALQELSVLAVAIALPPAAERAAIWSAALGGAAIAPEVSAAYRLPLQRIAEGASLAEAVAGAGGRARPDAADVELAARAVSASSLGDL